MNLTRSQNRIKNTLSISLCECFVYVVGRTGVEPVTSCLSSKRSKPTELTSRRGSQDIYYDFFILNSCFPSGTCIMFVECTLTIIQFYASRLKETKFNGSCRSSLIFLTIKMGRWFENIGNHTNRCELYKSFLFLCNNFPEMEA